MFLLYLILNVLSFVIICRSQLVVNIRNGGGDIVIESIQANTTDDSIELKFVAADGTLTSQLIDFPNEVQIFKVYILGEEELGQSQYQSICFLKRFMRNEFISSDAMSKLRQKNPTAVRVAEEDKGQEVKHMDLAVNLEKSHAISPHLKEFCKEAAATTHTIDEDIKLISKSLAKDYDAMISATRLHSDVTVLARCSDVSFVIEKPCLCRYEVCVNWYPCGLKYCNSKDSNGKITSYRCGIKTCKKCRVFNHKVDSRKLCVWDMVD